MFRAKPGAAVAARDGRAPELRARRRRALLSQRSPRRRRRGTRRVQRAASRASPPNWRGGQPPRKPPRGAAVVCTSRPRGAARRRAGFLRRRRPPARRPSQVRDLEERVARERAVESSASARKGRGAVGARRATRRSRRSPPRRRGAAGPRRPRYSPVAAVTLAAPESDDDRIPLGSTGWSRCLSDSDDELPRDTRRPGCALASVLTARCVLPRIKSLKGTRHSRKLQCQTKRKSAR